MELTVRGRPSVAYGLAAAGRLWRLVIAGWLLSVVVFVPAYAVLWSAAGGTLAVLPAGGLPEGEMLLIVAELLRPVAVELAVAMLSGWLALWGWTVLWHAGVVRWLLFAGRVEVRLAEILGYGLLGWWRWARLALTSGAALALAFAAIWLSLGTLAERALEAGRETSSLVAMLAAVGLAALVVTLAWLATLRGSWLLGAGDRRSAVLAWVAGLAGSLRQPLRSAATLVAWAIPGFAAMALPLAAGWGVEVLRDGLPGAVVEVAAGLLGAFCWVGLFLSFAPVTGLVGEEETRSGAPG